MREVITLFREYMGTGLVVIWFGLSLLYLFLREKRKMVRILFVYVPVILLLIFFNPLFAKLVYRFADAEVYYRILWLLPITPVIAYVVIDLFGQLAGKGRWVFAGAAAVLLMISGSLIYQNPFFHKAENWYHIPQNVVDICDIIKVEGREVMAVFPIELLQYVRQYDGTVCMPYGREVTVDRWNKWGFLCDAMEAEETDAAQLADLARGQGCHYIILAQDKNIVGTLAEYDYVVFGQVDGYVIYKDARVDLMLPLQQAADQSQ
ncbi:MAG: hypothetical protein NC417_06370 [Candidatus Gastranaerophilales bacterium]|nr:hypothetical protein [Candidatus Gastranaerophilales bacterium]